MRDYSPHGHLRGRSSGSSLNSSRYSDHSEAMCLSFCIRHLPFSTFQPYYYWRLHSRRINNSKALEATQNYNDTSTHNTTIEMSMEIQSLSNKHLLPLENVSTTNTRAAEQEKQLHWNLNITATWDPYHYPPSPRIIRHCATLFTVHPANAANLNTWQTNKKDGGTQMAFLSLCMYLSVILHGR